jgi:hypothetical protein
MEFAFLTGSTIYLAADKRCSILEPDGTKRKLHDQMQKIKRITPVTYIAGGGLNQALDIFNDLLQVEFFNGSAFKHQSLTDACIRKLIELCQLADKQFRAMGYDFPLDTTTISLTLIDWSSDPRIAIFDPLNNFMPVFRSHEGAYFVKGAIAPDVFLPEIRRINEANISGDPVIFLHNVFMRAAALEKTISPTFDLVFISPKKCDKNAKSGHLTVSFNTTGYMQDTITSRGQIPGFKIVNGSVSIDKLKTEELVVGDRIQMGPNAYIAWDHVTDADTYSLQAWANSGYATYIDENGVYTGTLTANQINAIQGITLGANATINWAQVAKPSYTADEVGALPSDTYIPPEYTDAKALAAWEASGYSTYINANGVYSGSFNGGMFNVNPTGSSTLPSGLTIGGWYPGTGWVGQALQIKYEPDGDGGFPGTVISSEGGVPLNFGITANFDSYVRFRSGSSVDFTGTVNFTSASVQGLTAKFA